MLRPEELEDAELARWLQREAMFGSAATFDRSAPTQIERRGPKLVLTQPDAALRVDEDGTIDIEQPLWDAAERLGLRAVIHEEVAERLDRAFKLGTTVLEHVDPLHRLTDLVPVVALTGAAYGAWRSRAEQARNPQQMEMNMRGDERVQVALPAPRLQRGALADQASQLARDLTILLRRATTGAA